MSVHIWGESGVVGVWRKKEKPHVGGKINMSGILAKYPR